MRNNQPVHDLEVLCKEGTPLVSTTDKKGRIVFVNDAFVDISGFTRDELIGQPHNMVRHPDVPPAVFADMWSKLKQDKPWIGIVKNRCKDGGYYWVNAYVTPIKEAGETIGYQSVRTKPNDQHKRMATATYARVARGGRQLSLRNLSLSARLGTYGLILPWLGLGGAYLSGFSLPGVIVAGALTSALAIGLNWSSLGRLRALESRSRAIIDSPVLQEMYVGSVNEISQISLSEAVQEARIRSASERVGYSAQRVHAHSTDSLEIAEQVSEAMERQVGEVERVAVHIEELSQAIEEVAANATRTSDETSLTNQVVEQGKDVVDTTVSSIMELATRVEQAVVQVESLRSSALDIAEATSVITDIADQTNLLALNAAIEAARAGDQGRGFAVVADEVRTLAQRTQDTTRTIDAVIERLAKESQQVASSMEVGQTQAQNCVGHANQAGEALESILQSVHKIADMSSMIAAASVEQSAAATELSENLTGIKDSSLGAQDAAGRAYESSQALSATAKEVVQSVNV
ncbi:methyl-accepting chemotaxis protein [Aliamphritea hakodatensis]|uniref:methyl-accepting chemotaxis protein n=1 Tax=Aliamphritea hakodatensis TaxID=2895352 RepID=UPI0022FD5F30|nr:PAS domain-containing methyl-accepting chemotaxis protein [Aliamphritea hakodatensis]